MRLATAILIQACVQFAFLGLAAAAARKHGPAFSLLNPLTLGVSAASVVVTALAGLHCPPGVAVPFSIAAAACIGCALSDAYTGYIFDAVTLPGLGIALLASAAAGVFNQCAAGALAAGGALGVLYVVTRGRGLGMGDIKMACCIGAGLGAAGSLGAIAISFIAGGAYAAYLLIAKRGSRGDCMRFGPYLAFGFLAVSLHRLFPQ